MTDVTPEAVRGSRLRRWFTRLWKEFQILDDERLEQELDEFAAEKHKRAPAGDEGWHEKARILESHARERYRAGERNAAWSNLKAAERELIWSFSLEELRVEAERVALESGKKLSGWRADAVTHILSAEWAPLTDAEGIRKAVIAAVERQASSEELRSSVIGAVTSVPARPTEEETSALRTRVVAAREILDGAMDNMHRVNDMLQIQVRRSALSLAILIVLTVVILAVQLAAGWSPGDTDFLLRDLRSFLVVLVLGAVGASLSGLLTLSKGAGGTRVPDLRMRWTFLKYRPVVGMISAIIVVAILQSGLAGLDVQPEAALVAAFVAGFSERLVTRSLDSAAANLGG